MRYFDFYLLETPEVERNVVEGYLKQLVDDISPSQWLLAVEILTRFGEQIEECILTATGGGGGGGGRRVLTYKNLLASILGHSLHKLRTSQAKENCQKCALGKMCAETCFDWPPDVLQCSEELSSGKSCGECRKSCPSFVKCPPAQRACQTCEVPGGGGGGTNETSAKPPSTSDGKFEHNSPVTEEDLKRVYTCNNQTDHTCSFRDTCGAAPRNKFTKVDVLPNGAATSGGYIVNGRNQIYGEWPSYVSVEISHGFGMLRCGGVLISNQHVLTAAHCVTVQNGNGKGGVFEPRQFTLRLADHKLFVRDEFELKLKAKKVCRSSGYDLEPNTNFDFAVLTLEKEVDFNDYIQPACLPYAPIDTRKTCFLVGSGVTRATDGEFEPQYYPETVQKMRVEQVSCGVWGIDDWDRGRMCFAKKKSRQIKFGDSCNGDSGGPVLCLNEVNENQRQWTVVGLVSFGTARCNGEDPGWVGVYARVRELLGLMKAECKV